MERGRIVVNEPGKYGGPIGLDPKLSVGGERDKPYIPQGSLVEFYVSGFKADQTALFQNGHPEEVNLTAFVPPTVLGDANGNGDVNILDMTKVARIILQLDAETIGADADLDGVVNVLDLTKVVRIILMLD